MKGKCAIILAFLGCCYGTQAQIDDKNLFPSPTAGGLGLYGQIPVNYFTGVPDIEIPLYTFKSRNISVPIELSYHSSGVKPSDHASWVGLGWSLQAGGVITRIQNDLIDELVDNDNQYDAPLQRGFFYRHGLLDSITGGNWTSNAALDTAEVYNHNVISAPTFTSSHNKMDYSPDEFQFNFMGMSGSLFMGQDGAWHLKSKQALNFNVQTEIGRYAVREPGNQPALGSNSSSVIHYCLSKFTLTAADGMIYVFGTDTATGLSISGGAASPNVGVFSTPDSNAIEFTRIGTGYWNGPAGRDGGTIPTTWFLTKVKSPTGDSIMFRYTRDGFQLPVNTTDFGSTIVANGAPSSFTVEAGDNVTIIDGVTLSSIIGADGTIQFYKSTANVMNDTTIGLSNSPPDQAWYGSNGLFNGYLLEVFQDNGGPAYSRYMQLDSFAVNDLNGAKLRSFDFTYQASSTNRLFLSSVLEKGGDNSSLMPYSFVYNNIAGLNSIPYNTTAVDHWGYFTDVYPLINIFNLPFSLTREPKFGATTPGAYTTDAPNELEVELFGRVYDSIYIVNRSPVPSAMQDGILTQINYPMGGSTQFTWEPNSYSKYMQVGNSGLSLTVQDQGKTSIGGGLRIRQISSQANFNSPAVTKTFLYTRDYIHGNTLSSGVLNTGLPLYVDSVFQSGELYYRAWSSNNVMPAYYTGNSPVTYSAVTILNADGSFVVDSFSNQDNGYPDKPPVNNWMPYFTNIGTLWNAEKMSSFDLERGLLLKESMYTASDTVLKKTSYQYDTSSSRLNNSIRRYSYDRKFSVDGGILSFDGGGFLTFSPGGSELYFGDVTVPLNIYIEYPSLVSKTDTNYDQHGANSLVKKTSYTYDSYRNKTTETFTSSKNEPVVTTYNYAANTINGLSAAAQQGQTAMVSAGMVGIPLETIETRSGTQTMHNRTDYQSYTDTNTFIVPANSYQSSYGQPMDSATRYINYDTRGNVAEYINRDGLTTCLDWGYNQAYPTVKVVNANNTLRSYPVVTPTTGGSVLSWAASNFSVQQVSFTVGNAGSIVFSGSFGGQPGTGDQYLFNYNLQGPVSESGWLCICSSPSTCPSYPSSITYSNMPPGNYTLQVYTNSSNSMAADFVYSYPENIIVWHTTGAKNYFYEGFEENTNVAVVTGAAHTGNYYWGSGRYSPGFIPPDNNTYVIEWWSLQNGIWTFNTGTYSSFMTLAGPIDDIRIFPSGAQMQTYTYQPMVGMTSVIDVKGYTMYYNYDGMGRLATVLDKDKNVLKRYCYNYAGQTQSCQLNATPAMVSINGTNSTSETIAVTFQNQANNAVYNFNLPPGSARIGEVPAGTYGVLLSPTTYNASDPNLYELYTFSQTYYAAVGYSGINVSGNCPINVSPAPNVPIDATNTTTETFTIEFANTANNATYFYTLPPGTATIGNIPPGIYNVLMSPNTFSSSAPNLYEIYSGSQTYYAAVAFGNANVTGSSCPIHISPAN